MMETRDPITQLREHARKVSDMAAGFSERGFQVVSPLGFQLEAIANEIEAQYLKLPVDADGVPIWPGDTVGYFTDGQRMYVQSVCEKGIYYRFSKGEIDAPLPTGDLCHVKPDTVEGILNELIEVHTYKTESCNEDVIADYAERIRKAVKDGD